jgi:hypothetical protein
LAEFVLLIKQMAYLEATGDAHHFIKVWQIHNSSGCEVGWFGAAAAISGKMAESSSWRLVTRTRSTIQRHR